MKKGLVTTLRNLLRRLTSCQFYVCPVKTFLFDLCFLKMWPIRTKTLTPPPPGPHFCLDLKDSHNDCLPDASNVCFCLKTIQKCRSCWMSFQCKVRFSCSAIHFQIITNTLGDSFQWCNKAMKTLSQKVCSKIFYNEEGKFEKSSWREVVKSDTKQE